MKYKWTVLRNTLSEKHHFKRDHLPNIASSETIASWQPVELLQEASPAPPEGRATNLWSAAKQTTSRTGKVIWPGRQLMASAILNWSIQTYHVASLAPSRPSAQLGRLGSGFFSTKDNQACDVDEVVALSTQRTWIRIREDVMPKPCMIVAHAPKVGLALHVYYKLQVHVVPPKRSQTQKLKKDSPKTPNCQYQWGFVERSLKFYHETNRWSRTVQYSSTVLLERFVLVLSETMLC